MKTCELTDYPRIYERTNWGNLDLEMRPMSQRNENIIHNRNRFIEDYDITKCINDTNDLKKISYYMSRFANGYFRNYWDHPELYKTIDGRYIFVLNPYQRIANPSENEFLDECGFQRIDPLYCDSEATYVKDLSDLRIQEVRMMR